MKNTLKQAVATLAHKLGYQISRYVPPDKRSEALSFQHVLEVYLVNNPQAVFCEIGANDGITSDPIYLLVKQYNLRGVVIEPQPDVFERLKQNYANTAVECIAMAVADKPEEKILYVAKESLKNQDNYKQLTGIASFKKEVILKTIKNKLPPKANPADCVEEKVVKADTVENILTSRNIKSIDILQIDTEGYDFEIIKGLNFDVYRPSIINFESYHLSAADYAACLELLARHGYKYFVHGMDTCAYLTRIKAG
jgi:FkbM family methyltransferase